MNYLFLLGDTVGNQESIKSFVSGIMDGVTSNIALADVGIVVASIIAAGIVAIFAWKFARKGFAFVRNALSGKAGKI